MCLNVALYGDCRRWTMTERGRRHGRRSERDFAIGPSHLHWDGHSLQIEIDEVGMPLPQRVRGRVRVWPQGLSRFVTPLDDGGRHRWGPIGPVSRVEVDFEQPDLHWRGHAYLDSNEGDEPIDRPFALWDWSRSAMADGSTAVIYDVRQKSGVDRVVAQRFAPDGSSQPFEAPPRQDLPGSLWRIPRAMRSASDAPAARVLQTLEDTPFYARSVVDSSLLGERVTSFHESLLLPRVVRWPVRLMLPFRMPRRS
ncbi:carotenoid 1,2-hydratase [Rubrivivax sp. RP6-9]|uniref:carotenoid 1,2-hydratase n=1 Tax=Rubrivivax sp. RP6-9 TaxID=3415750 RepID=UPI003CC56D07